MIRPESITSEWYYNYTVARIEQLQGASPDTPEAQELNRLAELVAEYEMRMAAFDTGIYQRRQAAD